jgi:hypothetical protein
MVASTSLFFKPRELRSTHGSIDFNASTSQFPFASAQQLLAYVLLQRLPRPRRNRPRQLRRIRWRSARIPLHPEPASIRILWNDVKVHMHHRLMRRGSVVL